MPKNHLRSAIQGGKYSYINDWIFFSQSTEHVVIIQWKHKFTHIRQLTQQTHKVITPRAFNCHENMINP